MINLNHVVWRRFEKKSCPNDFGQVPNPVSKKKESLKNGTSFLDSALEEGTQREGKRVEMK